MYVCSTFALSNHKVIEMNDNPPLFNPALLLDKLEGDTELVKELLQAFYEDAPVRLDTLVRTIADSDSESAAEAAHSLKGMCGVIRVKPLVDQALLMEVSCRKGEMAPVRDIIGEFEAMLKRVLEEVRDYLA